MEIDFNALEELKEKTIVVEGKKDVRALQALGVHHIIPINGKPLVELVSLLKGKEIVILTDFDAEGRKIAARLRSFLERYKIRSNPRLRRAVACLGKSKVEDLKSLVFEIKEGDSHGKIGANVNKICDKGHNKGQGCNREARCDRGYFWTN